MTRFEKVQKILERRGEKKFADVGELTKFLHPLEIGEISAANIAAMVQMLRQKQKTEKYPTIRDCVWVNNRMIPLEAVNRIKAERLGTGGIRYTLDFIEDLQNGI